MPKARTHARLAVAAALLASVAVAAAPPRADVAMHSEPPPTPLRALYLESELVVVARVGDSVLASREDEVSLFSTALHVSKFLKGESKESAVDLRHEVWGEEAGPLADFEKGETLLLFLKRDEPGGGYSLTDDRFAAKKLKDEHLKVYVRRIEELAAIASGSAKPDPAEIAEWLVRCAEEPATRWEGAYELTLNVETPSPDDEETATAADGGAQTDAAAQTPAAPIAGAGAPGGGGSQAANDHAGGGGAQPAEEETPGAQKVEIVLLHHGVRRPPGPDFAALLTQSHKERLAESLFNAEELGEGEMMLLPLAAKWKDARLAPFILKHLQRMADKPTYEAEMLMLLAARALGDKGLVKLAADYRAGASYDDLDFPVGDEAGEAVEDEEGKKELAERKAKAAETLNWRSTKLYHFLALAGQPQKP